MNLDLSGVFLDLAQTDDRERLGRFAERLKEAVKSAGGNARVAELSGVPLSTLNTYLAARAEAKITTVIRLAAACGVQVAELLEETVAGRDAGSRIPEGFVAVPRLDVGASAGGGRLASAEAVEGRELIAFREDWMRRIGLSPRFAQALTAVGDSMEPTIRDGDLLLIDRSIDRVVDNGIYVVVVAGMVLVKRIQTRRDGSVVLKSDNDRYDPELVPAAEVLDLIVEGRVRWFGRTI